ncbi:MAG TPA: potassium transporter Kup [Longimicrobiaceae bacterium]|nr:potassium transporter Kup [Longimicrobiaceae bacterium]
MSDGSHVKEEPSGRYLYVLALGALGVVYGDIGTSPLYAMREAFSEHSGLAPTPENVLGILSLIFWALIIVISIKYLAFVMRADNRGEGGMIALTALVVPRRATSRASGVLVLLGLFGASLLYGDSMITPAISVLSAVEGLEVATPLFAPYVVPITVVILVGLFSIQRHGTGSVGKVFGPLTLLWFVTLGVLGVSEIVRHPAVLAAVSPYHGAAFFARNGTAGFLVLGSVFLVVTGGEALYADMGHFGRRPIRLTWFSIVLPALLLNYFGQGALLARDPAAAEHPFFLMAPGWATYPLVVLATAATVIASQAVISGAFSLTRQAVQLGYLPRMDIEHTSAREIGQIYIPGVNWLLMLACIGLVVGFGESSGLAAAYGVAVTTDMVFTTLLFAAVARMRWRWAWWRVGLLAAAFLVVDLAFWGANLVKIPHGGWFPLLVAAAIFTLMTTWKKGRGILAGRLQTTSLPFDLFMADVEKRQPPRVPGTAVFMYGNPTGTPPALLHNLVHNKVLHERVVLLTVENLEIPLVDDAERVSTVAVGHGFYRITIRYGFTEDPDIPAALALVDEPGLDLRRMQTSYFLGRETLIPSKKPGMAMWREHLFSIMSRNARPATSFFQLPPNRVVELGAQIEL